MCGGGGRSVSSAGLGDTDDVVHGKQCRLRVVIVGQLLVQHAAKHGKATTQQIRHQLHRGVRDGDARQDMPKRPLSPLGKVAHHMLHVHVPSTGHILQDGVRHQHAWDIRGGSRVAAQRRGHLFVAPPDGMSDARQEQLVPLAEQRQHTVFLATRMAVFAGCCCCQWRARRTHTGHTQVTGLQRVTGFACLPRGPQHRNRCRFERLLPDLHALPHSPSIRHAEAEREVGDPVVALVGDEGQHPQGVVSEGVAEEQLRPCEVVSQQPWGIGKIGVWAIRHSKMNLRSNAFGQQHSIPRHTCKVRGGVQEACNSARLARQDHGAQSAPKQRRNAPATCA